MEFVHPEAFLLVPLLALVMRRHLWPRPLLGSLRVLVVLLLATVLAQPHRGAVEDGRDVVFVVDRSRSMRAGHLSEARELAAEVADALPAGDRIGVVVFGRGAAVVSSPSAGLRWPEETAPVDPDRSELGEALSAALGLVGDGRNASLLVWSDGEVPRDAAEAAARLASRRGVRIDVVPVPRAFGVDAAVHDVRLPAEAPLDAPFAVTATVVTSAGGPATWRLIVDGATARSGEVALRDGRNTLQLRHRLSSPGEHLVALEVSLEGDAVPQNDRGVGVVRGTARTRVLCVTPGGRDDRLTRSLREAGIEVVVAAADRAPLDLGALDGFRAVVLEDVPASDLPPNAMRDLAHWVRELGGGLLMTGGRSSFGVGGYHQSPIEAVLPVTMEIRDEQRRFGLALAIALDRSGSMQASVGDTTKMQLANRGAAAAVGMLSAIDAVTVLAVDTDAHVVQPLTAVEDVEEIERVVRTIESSGGGIYVGRALHEAADQLGAAAQEAKHVVVFADADDTEKPEDYLEFVPSLVERGFTVSVIGLGTLSGRDAALLEEIAQLGDGRCQFVADANELPRVFAQETIQVARSSLVDEPTDVRERGALQLLGAVPTPLPRLGGYTVAWTRELAELDLAAPALDEATDEPPLLAHWQVGLGRGAAFLGEADGELTGAWAEWDGYGDFFAVVVRWLCGSPPGGVFVDARREGDVGVYRLEVEAERAAVLEGLRGHRVEPGGRTEPLAFEQVAPGRVEVRVPLVGDGVHRAAVQLGDETLRLPPMCLPFSAEWALQPDARAGERTLRYLATRTGGRVAPTVHDVLDGPRRSLGQRDLSPWFAAAALLLFVLEVAMRRLQVHLPTPWSSRAAAQRAPRPAADDRDDDDPPPPPAEPAEDLLSALERAHRRGSRRV